MNPAIPFPVPEPRRRPQRWALALFAGFVGVVLAQRPATRLCTSCFLPEFGPGPGPLSVAPIKAPNPTRDALPGWFDLPGSVAGPGLRSAGR